MGPRMGNYSERKKRVGRFVCVICALGVFAALARATRQYEPWQYPHGLLVGKRATYYAR